VLLPSPKAKSSLSLSHAHLTFMPRMPEMSVSGIKMVAARFMFFMTRFISFDCCEQACTDMRTGRMVTACVSLTTVPSNVRAVSDPISQRQLNALPR